MKNCREKCHILQHQDFRFKWRLDAKSDIARDKNESGQLLRRKKCEVDNAIAELDLMYAPYIYLFFRRHVC